MNDPITTNTEYQDPVVAGPGIPDKPDDDMGFASGQEQAKAAGQADINYSHSASSDDGSGLPGNVGTGAGTLGDNIDGTDVSGARNRATQNKTPGPGTASDRGYGTTGSNDFGTGLSDTGLGSASGMDERSLGQDADPSDAGDTTYGANETFSEGSGTITEGRGSVGMDRGQGGMGDAGLGRTTNR